MPLSDLWALELIVAAFAGGAFGAAIGALPSFALAGLLVVLGETAAVARAGLGGTPLPVDVTGAIAFGPVFGPHVAFGGGAAAVAYAAKRGYLDTGFDYHEAKQVTRGLGSRPDVLAVGGAFGILGHWIATLAGAAALPTDPVALGVVGSALLHRAAFGYSLVGAAPRRLLDMTPFERGVRVGTGDATSGTGRGTQTDGGRPRLAVEPWLPYQYRWSHVAALGLVVGVIGGYLAYATGSAFLAFGLSVVPLGLLSAGMERVPVTHHMSLPASTGVLAMAGASSGFVAPGVVAAAVPMAEAVVVGAAFGLVGALLGELAQRVLYAHADTHLDPPAASIVVTAVLIAGLAAAGVLPTGAWIPVP